MATSDSLGANIPASAIRLHHGTDDQSANTILQLGVDHKQAGAWNVSGEFWATTSAADAEVFAQVNPAGGVPALFSFDLPHQMLLEMVDADPPQAYRHSTNGVDWYEFLPGGFSVLNQRMENREVISPVP